MIYDYPNGYSHGYTAETTRRLNDPHRGPGRIKLRYNVYLRDGNLTIIHHDLTLKEMRAVEAEIKRQHNTLW